MLALAPSAAAQSVPAPGETTYATTPAIAKASCLRNCASARRARGGSTLKIVGAGLAAATEVVFMGAYGRRDNVRVPVRAGSDTRLHLQVPTGAVSGPLVVVTGQGTRSRASAPLSLLPPVAPPPNVALSAVPGPSEPGAPQLETGTSTTKAYVDARPAVRFSFRLSGAAPTTLRVELVSATTGATVKTWSPAAVAPGEVRSVSWSGRIGPVAAPAGRYSFRLIAAGASGATARSAQAGVVDRDSFDLYDHVFPIRGRHDYGEVGAAFGSGRGGRSHQGHDVFATCGTRLVAARGGRVQYEGYHGAAGNYLVIDGAGTDVDYAYMHMTAPTPFAAGDRVYTGQQVGTVGATGNARGCHLHFEMWGAPGWYDGGSAFDPLPSLQSWDSWS